MAFLGQESHKRGYDSLDEVNPKGLQNFGVETSWKAINRKTRTEIEIYNKILKCLCITVKLLRIDESAAILVIGAETSDTVNQSVSQPRKVKALA
jgi:hypothetical protein